jgi:ubiquitin conjugation factor E4 B
MNTLVGPYGGEAHGDSLNGPEIDRLISDLQTRFPGEDDGLDDILGPLIRLLLLHPSLALPEGLSAGDAGWRAILTGLELMVKHRSICNMITRQNEWCPEGEDAANIEKTSFLGPLLRLGVFAREWVRVISCPTWLDRIVPQPSIAKSYFSNPQARSRNDVESSNSSLRSTLNTLQVRTTLQRIGFIYLLLCYRQLSSKW